MNAAEKIVETYFRYIRRLFTRTSLKGAGQVELDLVGADPCVSPSLYYHIESSVSISSSYSKITNKPYSEIREKQRQEKAGQRRTAGFFIQKKFFAKDVITTLELNGCDIKNIKRIVVAWKFDDDAIEEFNKKKIECLTMKTILQELVDKISEETCDLDSDILRTIQLFIRSEPKMPSIYSIQTLRNKKRINPRKFKEAIEQSKYERTGRNMR